MEIVALLLPLAAALGYAIASLVLKRAIAQGAGVVLLMVLGNWITAFIFAVIFGFDGFWNPDAGLFWALVGALGFLLGQCFSIWAVHSGEVSVQTPLMGSKTVIVAGMSALIGLERLGGLQWLAVLLSLFAVFMIAGGSLKRFASNGQTVLLVLLACVGFGLADVSVAKGAEAYGVEGFILFVVMASALGSLCLLLLPKRLLTLPRGSRKWALWGGLLLAIQSLGMNLAIGYFGQPTLTNVLYSTRGLMGVILVWWIGAWFGNGERQGVSVSLMFERLLGSSLIVISVVLMLL